MVASLVERRAAVMQWQDGAERKEFVDVFEASAMREFMSGG